MTHFYFKLDINHSLEPDLAARIVTDWASVSRNSIESFDKVWFLASGEEMAKLFDRAGDYAGMMSIVVTERRREEPDLGPNKYEMVFQFDCEKKAESFLSRNRAWIYPEDSAGGWISFTVDEYHMSRLFDFDMELPVVVQRAAKVPSEQRIIRV